MLSALAAFLESDHQDFFAYIETTDTAAHLKGPTSMSAMFAGLGRAIRRARDSGEEFRVVVFSDHGIDGGEPLGNVLPGIRSALRSGGFRLAKRLVAAHDVVLTPYGLVSSFEAYARPGQAPRLARLLASVEGVDLCAYRFEDGLWVASADGLARIGRREAQGASLWAYAPIERDPLRYADVVRRLADGEISAGGTQWFADERWFTETRERHYPDALRRLARGFALVHNPATAICSLEEGFMFGARKTERAARIAGGQLRWTHGALFWNASAGFLWTDVPGAPAEGPLRLSSALEPLVSAAGRPLAARAASASDAVVASRE